MENCPASQIEMNSFFLMKTLKIFICPVVDRSDGRSVIISLKEGWEVKYSCSYLSGLGGWVNVEGSMPLVEVATFMWIFSIIRRLYNSYLGKA